MRVNSTAANCNSNRAEAKVVGHVYRVANNALRSVQTRMDRAIKADDQSGKLVKAHRWTGMIKKVKKNNKEMKARIMVKWGRSKGYVV